MNNQNNFQNEPINDTPKKSKKGLIITIVAVVLALVILSGLVITTVAAVVIGGAVYVNNTKIHDGDVNMDSDGDVDDDDNSKDTNSENAGVIEEDTSSSDNNYNELLNEKKNWGGENVDILGFIGDSDYATCQIDQEEGSSDPLKDAFYERNSYIEEEYGISINLVCPDGNQDPIMLLRNDMFSGLNEYEAVVNSIYNLAPLAAEGLLDDFNRIENGYIHLDEPWWDQALIEDLSINGHVYFLSGDALVTDDEATYGIFFNKDLIESYGLENPYDLVNNQQWTLDKMYEMLQTVSVTNGEVKSFDPTVGDVWGMVTQNYDFQMFMHGCEQIMVDNSGDLPVLRIMDEENVNTFKALAQMFINDSENVGVADYHGSWYDSSYENARKIFAYGNALFMPGSMSYVNLSEMTESSVNYGILPMPKRGEYQEYYTSGVNVYSYSVFAIPITNVANLDVTCYALEAMAFYGKEIVTEKYHEHLLTFRRFEDNESAEMLELILNNRTYDMGTVFNFNNGDLYNGTLYFYTNLIGKKSDEINSEYEARKNMFQAGIDELIIQCYN